MKGSRWCCRRQSTRRVGLPRHREGDDQAVKGQGRPTAAPPLPAGQGCGAERGHRSRRRVRKRSRRHDAGRRSRRDDGDVYGRLAGRDARTTSRARTEPPAAKPRGGAGENLQRPSRSIPSSVSAYVQHGVDLHEPAAAGARPRKLSRSAQASRPDDGAREIPMPGISYLGVVRDYEEAIETTRRSSVSTRRTTPVTRTWRWPLYERNLPMAIEMGRGPSTSIPSASCSGRTTPPIRCTAATSRRRSTRRRRVFRRSRLEWGEPTLALSRLAQGDEAGRPRPRTPSSRAPARWVRRSPAMGQADLEMFYGRYGSRAGDPEGGHRPRREREGFLEPRFEAGRAEPGVLPNAPGTRPPPRPRQSARPG